MFKRNFLKVFQKFLKISEQFLFVVQTREMLTHGMFKIIEKHANIIDFSEFS